MSQALLSAPPSVPPDLLHGYRELLSKTAHILLQDSDPDTLCAAIFKILCESLQVDSYALYLMSADGLHLELASSGGSEAMRRATAAYVNVGEGVCGHVARSHEPMNLSHVQERDDEMTRLVRECEIQCYICKPLMMKTSIMGTLAFGSRWRTEFLPEELELLSFCTQQVRLATERRLQNDYMHRIEQLAAAGRMCAKLAHEIRNPLASLSNFLYLLNDEVVSEDGKEFLRRAEDQIARLTEVLQRTLGQFRPHQQGPVRVSLTGIVNEVFSSISLPNYVHLRSKINDELYVESIPGEIRQVLFNLLINAAQFSPPDGQVVLTVRQSGLLAEIVVRDEGCGIEEARRANLFKPFYTTRFDGGTGIGLWISREMVERAHGTLDYKSNPAVAPGTEFIITLPLAGDQQVLPPAHAGKASTAISAI